MNINLSKLLKEFNEEYEYLYNTDAKVEGYDEAITYGDTFILENKEFIEKFCKYRGDILSSDREVAAFARVIKRYI